MDNIKKIGEFELWAGVKIKNIRFAFRRWLRLPMEFFYSFKYYLSFKPVRSCDITRGIAYLGKKRTILPHPVGIVIGNGVILGENCIIYQNVTIGGKSLSEFTYPVIGNNVTIFANALIIGNVKIGDNVTIGAGTVVLKDIPDNMIVIGNPARMILTK